MYIAIILLCLRVHYSVEIKHYKSQIRIPKIVHFVTNGGITFLVDWFIYFIILSCKFRSKAKLIVHLERSNVTRKISLHSPNVDDIAVV